MDAMLTETNFSYDGPPPLLVAATSEAALRRARDTAASPGFERSARSGSARLSSG
jgi:hypothetical protein